MFGRVARRIPLHRTPKTQLKRSLSSNTVPNAVSTSPESPLPQELLELVSNEGFLRTFSNAFLHVPEYLPSVCDSYSVSIVLLVLALRAGFTLPVTLWQRRRSDRLQRVVVPKMEEWAKQARERLRHQCRKQGKSYEEYVEIYNEAIKIKQKALEKEYKCQPRRTLFAPLLVHLPVFMLATTSIRDACIRSSAFKSHILQSTMGQQPQDPSATLPSEAGQLIPNMQDLTPDQVENAKLLLKISNETLWSSDNALLIHADPSYTLPILVGLTLLFNTELSSAIRARFLNARSEAQLSPASPVPPAAVRAANSAKPVRRSISTTSTSLSSVVTSSRKGPTSMTPTTSQSSGSADVLKAADSKFTPALRLLSVAMIIVACNAPMAVNLYWITSNVFTMIQNSAFAVLDRAKHSVRRPRE